MAASTPMRFFRHLLCDWWTVKGAFPVATLDAIEQGIGRQEDRHDGEIRFAVEAALPLGDLWRGVSSRKRAIHLFARLHVWDTAQNTGVLIYVLLADKRVEIVADRGIDAAVGQAAWDTICGDMERRFAAGDFAGGALAGIAAISDLLVVHFPKTPGNPNELPNRPIVV